MGEPLVNWTNDETTVLVNPKWPTDIQFRAKELLRKLDGFNGHVWIASSGTSSLEDHEQKWVALSKKSFLESAKSVNQHLESEDSDVWLQVLPKFHVGGLSIYARALLSGAKVNDELSELGSWSPEKFIELAEESKATLASLVPAQVFDLVSKKLPCPNSFRAIIVGGGALAPAIGEKAKKLGWPILKSYGMTECASQIATQSLNEDINSKAKILNHLKVKVSDGGIIQISGMSLLTSYAYVSKKGVRLEDPKQDGWLTTNDYGKLIGENKLEVYGRGLDYAKVSGENVEIQKLELLLESVRLEKGIQSPMVLLPMPEPRAGQCICLITEEENPLVIEKVKHSFNEQVLPYEKITSTKIILKIPTTPLGKPQKATIMRALNSST